MISSISLTPSLEARRPDLDSPCQLYGRLPEIAHHADPYTYLPLEPLMVITGEEAQEHQQDGWLGLPTYEILDHQGRHLHWARAIDQGGSIPLAADLLREWAEYRAGPPHTLAGHFMWEIPAFLRVPEHLVQGDTPEGDVEGSYFRYRPAGAEGPGELVWRVAAVRVGQGVDWYPAVENLRAVD